MEIELGCVLLACTKSGTRLDEGIPQTAIQCRGDVFYSLVAVRASIPRYACQETEKTYHIYTAEKSGPKQEGDWGGGAMTAKEGGCWEGRAQRITGWIWLSCLMNRVPNICNEKQKGREKPSSSS